LWWAASEEGSGQIRSAGKGWQREPSMKEVGRAADDKGTDSTKSDSSGCVVFSMESELLARRDTATVLGAQRTLTADGRCSGRGQSAAGSGGRGGRGRGRSGGRSTGGSASRRRALDPVMARTRPCPSAPHSSYGVETYGRRLNPPLRRMSAQRPRCLHPLPNPFSCLDRALLATTTAPHQISPDRGPSTGLVEGLTATAPATSHFLGGRELLLRSAKFRSAGD